MISQSFSMRSLFCAFVLLCSLFASRTECTVGDALIEIPIGGLLGATAGFAVGMCAGGVHECIHSMSFVPECGGLMRQWSKGCMFWGGAMGASYALGYRVLRCWKAKHKTTAPLVTGQ